MKAKETISAYYICGIIDNISDSENICYKLYDSFSHNEITGKELFNKVLSLSECNNINDFEPFISELYKDSILYENESIYLTFDKYTFAFDIWHK